MSLDLETSSNQYATWVPGSATANLSGATLTCWIRPESFPFNCILQFSVNGIAQNVRVGLVLTAAGVISVRARRLDGDSASTCNGGTLRAGVTYFVAGAVNYTGSRMDIYVAGPGAVLNGASGSLTGIAGWGSACSNTSSDAGDIGAFGDAAAGEQYDGLIQEARFYQRTLTLTELQNVYYLNGMGGASPRARWEMTTTSGTASTIADTMGNHDATAVNSPVYGATIFTPPEVFVGSGGGDHFRRRA